jgi:hypothetical protein
MLVLLLRAIYARYRSKIHLSQLFRFPEPLPIEIAMFRQSSPIITVVAAIWAVVVAPVSFAVEPLSDR